MAITRTGAVANDIPLVTGKVAQEKKKPFRTPTQMCKEILCL